MKIRTITLCSLFAALTAIGAFIRIPMPIVPFTLQFFFAALAGILLGAKKGALSQCIYVGIGLIGIPVFTKGGGIQYIFQPTFGYLLGFIAGAYVIGWIVEKLGTVNFKNLIFATVVGILVIYLIGVPYMYCIYNFYLGKELNIWSAITVGAISFIPSDLFSCFLTSVIGSKVVPVLKRIKLI